MAGDGGDPGLRRAYHDWNERICAECYAPNGAARILNNKNQIARIVNNYARISFNFGPTLLSWLKENAPRTYRMILEGERRSRKNFGGHSSAMAQVYNHIIMPLANRRDRMTQIRWGIADYEFHFRHSPRACGWPRPQRTRTRWSCWRSTASSSRVLAPHQCRRIRPLNGATRNAESTRRDALVDTTRPYLVRFESGVSHRGLLL